MGTEQYRCFPQYQIQGAPIQPWGNQLKANEDVVFHAVQAKSHNWLQKRFVEGKGIKVVKKGLSRLVENRPLVAIKMMA